MEPEEIYAAAALVASLIGGTGFVLLRFTTLGLTGLLILGAGVFLTIVFAAAALYTTLQTERSRAEGANDSVTLGGIMPKIHWRAVARSSGHSVAAFALAGLGIGLTGAVAIIEFGDTWGAIVGSILVLIVVATAFTLGPVVGLATGFGIADDALDGFIGATVGFIVMMALILLILAGATGGALIEDTSSTTDQPEYDRPDFMDPTPTPTPTPTPAEDSGGVGIWPWLRTILVFSIPTGLTGGGAAFLKSRVGT